MEISIPYALSLFLPNKAIYYLALLMKAGRSACLRLSTVSGQAGRCLRGGDLKVRELVQSFDGFALSWMGNGELGESIRLANAAGS